MSLLRTTLSRTAAPIIGRLTSAAPSLPLPQRRSFGAFHVPVGPTSKIDGVYRRPSVPEASGPLSEHFELMWDDDQAPEPVFDQYEDTNRWDALAQLVGGLVFMFGGVTGLVWLYGPESRQIVVPQEYPFNNLRLSQGGPGGAPVVPADE